MISLLDISGFFKIMRSRQIALISVAVFLLACSEQPQLSRLPADAVVLAFGDSLTNGNGAKKEESYPAVLETLIGRRVINEGISGEISEAGLKRLPGVLDKHQPELLILCHGGNDFLRKKDLRELESNLVAMISMAKERNIEVVMLGVPRPGILLSSADLYGRVAEQTGVLFVEDLISDVLGDNGLKSDAVHPNKKGYRLMAETIQAALQASGAL